MRGEFFQDYVLSNVLQDFVVGTTQDMGILIYTTDASVVPFRRYHLDSELPLNQLGFDIVIQYKDGSYAPVTLRPGSAFTMKMAFFLKR